MLLKDILINANLLVPNSLNDKLKVDWLNNVQSQLYREFGFPNTSHAFSVEVGINLYPFPENCSRERVTSLIVGETEYLYQTVDEEVTNHSWTLVDNKLWIYPTPTQNEQAYLNYRPRPNEMRVEMQDVEPEFHSDFHEVLVYGVAARIARANQDTNKALEMDAQYEFLQDKAKKFLRPSRQKIVKQLRAWR